MPGTVIKGAPNLDAANACAIVVARGGKIIADGTESCPIVMTTTEDTNFDGSYPICSRGKWGGLVILGKAKNNVTPNNGLYVSPGVAFVEGYPSANTYNLHGEAPGSENDDDNSGILRYVSVRHAGASIAVANELNGITLGSVGRGTTIEHVEVVGNDDDGIEFFGGAVNVKYVAMWWGNDDMFDWDLGWRGNAQFLFGIVSPDRVSIPGADNAFESDGDDKLMTSLPSPQSHPVIYNSTFIGDGASSSADFSGPSAIRGKEGGEGEIYNSIFANFRFGLDLSKSTSRAYPDAYDNWLAGTWIVKNNDFVNMTGGLGAMTKIVGGSSAVRTSGDATDLAKFTADGNLTAASLPGFDFSFAMTCTAPFTDKFDAQPNPARTSPGAPAILPPVNGFFKPVAYRGAFSVAEGNWLAGWSMGAINDGLTTGAITGAGDVNASGRVDQSDLNLVLQNWNRVYSK
jgi:hypothetical protein